LKRSAETASFLTATKTMKVQAQITASSLSRAVLQDEVDQLVDA